MARDAWVMAARCVESTSAGALFDLAESPDHAAWLAGVDALVAAGVDPFLAIVEADPR